jgi:hypothetical protein
VKTRSAPLLLVLLALLGALFWIWNSGGGAPEPARGVEVTRDLGLGARAEAELDPDGQPGLGETMRLDRSVLDVETLGVRVSGGGELDGLVIDRATGAGVADVRIALFAFPPQGADLIARALRLGKTGASFERRALPLAQTATESDGRFHFDGVRAGTYFAEARGKWFVPDPVERVTLAASGSEVTLFVRAGGMISGVVKRTDGKPVRGARVHVGQGAGVFVPALKSGDVLLKSAVADARGRFSIGGLPPGPGFQVSATEPSLGVAFLGGLEVQAGVEMHVELAFDPAATMTGRTMSRSLDDDGEESLVPLAGAEIAAVPRGLREMQFADELMAAAHATSGADGGFKIGALPPGDVDLIAWAPGHLPARIGPLPSLAGGAFRAGDLVLEAGSVVHGRVVDEAGAPVEGVHVRWEMVNFDRGFELTFAPLLIQAIEGFDFPTTDAEGRFVAGPFPGSPRFRMQLFKTGFAERRAYWDGSSTAELEIVLKRGSAVEGIVVDAVAKRPVTRFTIRGESRVDTQEGAPGAWNPFGGGQLVEDPKGHFRVPAVKPGKRSLVFSAEGYQSREIDGLAVEAGNDLLGLIVQLDPGASLRGTVVDEDGAPVAGVRLAATQEGGFERLRATRRGKGSRRGRNISPNELAGNMPMGALAFGVGLGLVPSVLSDAEGHFELDGLGSGKWIVAGTHRDYSTGASEPVDVRFAEGAEAPVIEGVVVTMERGASLYGSVRDRRGAKQPGVMVIAFSPAEFASGETAGGVYQAETNEEGDYRIDHMVSGGYFLMVTRGDAHLDPFSFLGTMQFDLVTVPESGELKRDLVDQTAASTRVHGVVLSAGVPVSGGAVMALSLEADNMLGVDIKMAAVGHAGAYEFPGLPEGLYQFRYEGNGPKVGREVEVPDLVETRIDLVLPNGAIEGVVVDAESGEPVANAEVVVRRLDAGARLGGLLGSLIGDELGKQSDHSTKDGSFGVDGLEAGTYEVLARSPRWGERKDDFGPGEAIVVEIVEGAPAERLTLELPRTHRIHGVVLDPAGLPVTGAWVLAVSTGSDGSTRKAKTSEDGRYEIFGVGLGVYDLTVRADAYAAAAKTGVEVRGDGAEVDFVLFEGVEVHVVILDAAGQSLPGAVASLELEGQEVSSGSTGYAIESWFVGRGVADLSGEVSLGRFAPGTYTLEGKRGSLVGSLGGIRVPEAGELKLELVLREG